MKQSHLTRPGARRWLAAGAVAAAAALTLAACGKSTTAGTGTSSSPSATASSGSPSANADAAITVTTASVRGVGTVLVNGNGRTLYRLSSEQGGKITCTDDNGCTAVWPDTELPSGTTAAIAGAGIQASLLGTVKSSDGKLYVTYNSYPLYMFVHDTGPGTANGQGITSFGGTWSAITPAGGAATATKTSATTSPSASKKPSSSGYGY